LMMKTKIFLSVINRERKREKRERGK